MEKRGLRLPLDVSELKIPSPAHCWVLWSWPLWGHQLATGRREASSGPRGPLGGRFWLAGGAGRLAPGRGGRWEAGSGLQGVPGGWLRPAGGAVSEKAAGSAPSGPAPRSRLTALCGQPQPLVLDWRLASDLVPSPVSCGNRCPVWANFCLCVCAGTEGNMRLCSRKPQTRRLGLSVWLDQLGTILVRWREPPRLPT